MESFTCRLKEQGREAGSCLVKVNGEQMQACQATLKFEDGKLYRLISAIHLSRPENYLSIYQSGCNLSCRKCHSWQFSKIKDGEWYTPDDILEAAVAYEKNVTLMEPREKATAWHAHDSCRCCGTCSVNGSRSSLCPGELERDAIALSPQGFGPVRNIVAFTGGDLTCNPDFYAACALRIKNQTRLHVLVETNGYGLTPDNLEYLDNAGVDAFWLDIKAFNSKKHKWLTGCSNDHILTLPEKILRRGFVLEVLSLYIPRLVEADELERIARLLGDVEPTIPFTILAFFPEHRMKDIRSPSVSEMVAAYQKAKAAGLKNVRLGNVGIFAGTPEDQAYLEENVEKGAF